MSRIWSKKQYMDHELVTQDRQLFEAEEASRAEEASQAVALALSPSRARAAEQQQGTRQQGTRQGTIPRRLIDTEENSYQSTIAAGLTSALEIHRDECPPTQTVEKYKSNHPTSLFNNFKKIIQNEANKEINDVFVDSQKFQKMIEELNVTKLSKKEKIKILLLSGFELKDENQKENYKEIYDTMIRDSYVTDTLIPYLEDNQYMIAIRMDEYNTDDIPYKDPILFYNNLTIEKNDKFLKVNSTETGEKIISIETQVIYLLHNVMMD